MLIESHIIKNLWNDGVFAFYADVLLKTISMRDTLGSNGPSYIIVKKSLAKQI